MRYFFALLLVALLASCSSTTPPPPIKALLLTGGCCHNYESQKAIIQKFTTEKLNVVWDVIHEGGKGGDHKFSIYSEKDWAKKYDVVVHNECFAKTNDDAFITKIVQDHLDAGIGVIMVHCAMHTFRDANEGTKAWTGLIGLRTNRHEHQANYEIENIAEKHPIMAGFPQVWTAPKDELYIVLEEFKGITPLARAYGEGSKKFSTCIWTNEIGKCKVFGITFGHNDTTFEAAEFQAVFNRGLLWTIGKLNSDGTIMSGYEAKATSTQAK